MIRQRMYAVLSATNEAILRTEAEKELFQRVCEAAVHSGGLKSAAALLPEADGWLRIVAASGFERQDATPDLHISVSAGTERGRGLVGTAFRSGKTTFTNDFQNDPRLCPWVLDQQGKDIGAAVAVPIVRDGQSMGVFVFLVETPGSITTEVLALLERMVENVSFALGLFERKRQREKDELANRQLSDMFAVLSATNTAILHSRTRQEMFEAVSASVAMGGKSLGAVAILIEDPVTHILEVAAASGEGVDLIHKTQLSTDPSHPRGQGLAGLAFREQKLKICYDLTSDDRTKSYAASISNPYGGAAVPLIVDGKSVGVLYFFFPRMSGKEDPEVFRLMEDIGENISFGLAMLKRGEEKEILSRMYAALSATTEAIMRAQTREEMFQLVCEAAVTGAKFSFTAVGLARENRDYFEIAAVAGPTSYRVRSLKFSPREDLSEGRGLTGTAYRTGKPAISNDYQQDQRSAPWRGMQNGSKSGAAIPLLVWGKPIGFILFMSQEKGTFSDGLVDLLERLAGNVSFALENFDRRDEAKKAEARIQYLATHDSLTSLPNRSVFMHMLEHSIATAHRNQRQCAVLFIDLDRFKIVNDSLGHSVGDRLLIEIASRLKVCVRECDVVARFGGDEFVSIINCVSGEADVEIVARKILVNLVQPIDVLGHAYCTTASIGIAVYPHHGADATTLVKNADIAMYAAKDGGKSGFRFFSSETRGPSRERLTLETSLRQALELDQLTLHYQPKISAASGEVMGVEALLRWVHPELGTVPPLKFIPLAEETGVIVPIGRWVLRTACAQAVAWQNDGFPAISMAVNLSPRQFRDEHLLRDIDEVLQWSGLDPSLLQLEITESMVMQNVDQAITILNALHSRGVRLALDDFGTGYSSMSLMKQFPIDTIKVDRSFVRDLEESEKDRAIVTSIITLGKALGLTIVAEGVETRAQQVFLADKLCDQLQGYMFSKPVPAEAIPNILTQSAHKSLRRYSRTESDHVASYRAAAK